MDKQITRATRQDEGRPSEDTKETRLVIELEEKDKLIQRLEIGRSLDKIQYAQNLRHLKNENSLLKKAIEAYRSGNNIRAERLFKHSQALSTGAVGKGVPKWWPLGNDKLNKVFLYIEKAQKPTYHGCMEICSELDFTYVPVLFEPNYSHVNSHLGMGDRQFRRYLAGLEKVELIERIYQLKRRGHNYLFIIGHWSVWYKENDIGEKARRTRRIYTWRAKANRKWVLTALDKLHP